MTTARKIFLNLAVRDLAASRAFFTELGFSFNAQFSNETGLCMIVSEEAYVMLLTHDFFQTFTRKKIADSTTHSESIVALSCSSRAEVDQLVQKALAAGGSPAMEKQDHGFMYGWSFYDRDGHHWEVVWMDPAALNTALAPA